MVKKKRGESENKTGRYKWLIPAIFQCPPPKKNKQNPATSSQQPDNN